MKRVFLLVSAAVLTFGFGCASTNSTIANRAMELRRVHVGGNNTSPTYIFVPRTRSTSARSNKATSQKVAYEIRTRHVGGNGGPMSLYFVRRAQ